MVTPSGPPAQDKPHADQLLSWYDRHARVLPWRFSGNRPPDPYAIWLSEVMLQQTTVQAVKPYFEAFLLRWPRIELLANASVEDVMRMWAGLGYYSRARNLHACAKAVVERFDGTFPHDEKTLLTLPGVGAYTAAAISAIAFGKRAVVVDGNVERVIARLHRLETVMPQARREIRERADILTPQQRTGDFAQAMMDLGATICTPRNPACGICPFVECCAARLQGNPESYPRKPEKKPKATRYGSAYVVFRSDGALLVRARPPEGLLGGMLEVPGTDWSTDPNARLRDHPAHLAALSASLDWQLMDNAVRHVFTHFPLELIVYRAGAPSDMAAPEGMHWISANAIAGEAFPTLFRKVLEIAGK